MIKTRSIVRQRTQQLSKEVLGQNSVQDFKQPQAFKQDFGKAQKFFSDIDSTQRLRIRQELTPSLTPRTSIVPKPKRILDRKRLQNRIKEVELFTLEIREGGEFKSLGGDLTLSGALGLGARTTRKTLARTFRIRRTGRKKTIREDEDFGEPDLTGFRRFKTKGGRKIDTPLTFIQEKQFALGSKSERRLLQQSKQKSLKLNEILNM